MKIKKEKRKIEEKKKKKNKKSISCFFKQKTAYEMRISDWSSDVCSSDLNGPAYAPRWCRFPSRHRSAPLAPAPHRRGNCGAGDRGRDDEDRYGSLRPRSRNRTVSGAPRPGAKIGRATCRERGCQYVWNPVVAGS